MYSYEIGNSKIKVLTNGQLISSNSLPKIVYKNLTIRQKLHKKISISHISRHIQRKYLVYHPFWIAKITAFASRNPFPPKTTYYMAFVDGVSGYRGLLSNVPYLSEYSPNTGETVKPKIVTAEDALRYVEDVQQKQINSMYLLKKPKYKIDEIFLCYLPIWKIHLDSPLLSNRFVINANTGESEAYLLSMWEKVKNYN